jgi:ABC-2 type transport system permease protein
VAQGEIIDEEKLGTAAWILSKPVSRPAFILSKLFANAFNLLVVMVLLQGGLAYLIFAVMGQPLPIGPFVGALGLIFLHLLFYLTLTLMLGTLSEARGAVIGVPLLILFGFQMILPVLPAAGIIMPWALVTSVPGISGAGLVVDLLSGQALRTVTPIIGTALWCVIFTIVAVWRFNREEF